MNLIQYKMFGGSTVTMFTKENVNACPVKLSLAFFFFYEIILLLYFLMEFPSLFFLFPFSYVSII